MYSTIHDSTIPLHTTRTRPSRASWCRDNVGLPYWLLIITNILSTLVVNWVYSLILVPGVAQFVCTALWILTVLWLLFLGWMEYGSSIIAFFKNIWAHIKGMGTSIQDKIASLRAGIVEE